MALDLQYKAVFQKECNQLSLMVLGSLQKLSINPTDRQELSKLVQAADTIIGDARFLQDKELEKQATSIVKSFKKIKDVRKIIDKYSTAYEQFGRLIAHTGACPKGYEIVNGSCVRINPKY